MPIVLSEYNIEEFILNPENYIEIPTAIPVKINTISNNLRYRILYDSLQDILVVLFFDNDDVIVSHYIYEYRTNTLEIGGHRLLDEAKFNDFCQELKYM